MKEHVTRESYSTRGGGVEVKLDYLGYEGEFMSAYQNYLGGGMLGGVANDCSIPNCLYQPTKAILMRPNWSKLLLVSSLLQ